MPKLSLKVGDRVIARAVDFSSEVKDVGTIIKFDEIEDVLIEFDKPLIFPSGQKGHNGFLETPHKEGHCWWCSTTTLEPYQDPSATSLIGYQISPDGWLTNPDNWQPGKWLI